MRQAFWPEDDKWYPGRVAEFDRMKQRHRVRYDDGEVENLQLFAPGQSVPLSNLCTMMQIMGRVAAHEAMVDKHISRLQLSAFNKRKTVHNSILHLGV